MQTTSSDIMDMFYHQGAFFDVERENVFTAGGRQIKGKTALVNAETGDAIGIVSSRYKMIRNEDAMVSVLHSMKTAGVDLDGASAHSDTTLDGARSILTVRLPSYSVGKTEATETVMEVLVRNSYDGGWNFVTEAGGYRMKCLNGQIIGSVVGKYSARHSARLDAQTGADRMVQAVEDFQGCGNWWSNLYKRGVEEADIVDTFQRYRTGTNAQFEGGLDQFAENKTNRKLLETFAGYSQELGGNAYALYNTITDHATHHPKGAQAINRARDKAAFAIEHSPILAKA